MLFHNVLCVYFLALLAPNIETNADLETLSERPEAIFADVIKNISRVNTELQDLINNYEQLKKVQSSQEKFDEKEINDLSESEGPVNRNKKNIGNKRVSSGTTSTYHTKMILVEDEAEKSSQPQHSSEIEMSSQSENNSEAKNSSQSEDNNEEEPSKEEHTRSMENTNTKKRQKTQKAAAEVNIAQETTLERETENQKYVDNHNAINTNKEPETIGEQTYIDARNSEKGTQGKNSGSDSYQEDEPVTEEEQGASKRKRASDNNKDVATTKVTAGIFLRSRTDVPKTNRTPNRESPELSDNDVALNKDVFKTNILREAYGDACLKLVIRKCYKACKNALKNSMRTIVMKGKKKLKSYFKKQYKAGCDEVFEDKRRTTTMADDAASSESPASSCRRNLKNATLNKGVVTRAGYLSMACQSEMEVPLRRVLIHDTPDQTIGQVNILRDKYERACKRISQKKCKNACNKAKEATCHKFECQKRLKKNFKRNCKGNCKRAYSSKSSSESKSDSDSDSSSDDDSDHKSSKEDSSSTSKS